MSWLETKYVQLLSFQLDKFKKVGNKWNARCPYCNDSQKSKTKARGWIYAEKDPYSYHCFNCGITKSFPKFLQDQNQILYYDYISEKFADNSPRIPEIEIKSTPPVFDKSPFRKLQKISNLPDDHEAKVLIKQRLIPKEFWFDLYYTPEFKKYVHEVRPDKYEEIVLDEPRIIIPFRDRDGIIGFQGRSIYKSDAKYITIILDETKPKFFGLDRVNPTRTCYVFEGPFDAMFIDNAIASGGGKLEASLGLTSIKKENTVLVYDNEPRSKETVRKISIALKAGYKVCIWPSYGCPEKDVNDMVLAGMTPDKIRDEINRSTHSGLEGELALKMWSRA